MAFCAAVEVLECHGASDREDFKVFVVEDDVVAAFEFCGLVKDGDAVEQFARHFVRGVLALADGEVAGVVFLEFASERLQVVLV